MKLPTLLLALLLALCGLYSAFLFSDPPANAAGLAHPEYATMLQGGDPLRHSGKLMLGWLVALGQASLFTGLLVLGIRRGQRPVPGRGVFLAGLVAYLAVFSLLMLSYRTFMRDPAGAADRIFLSFPAPTAWMLYGVWIVPLVFLVLYMVLFEDWIYGPEEERKFQQLLAERRASHPESH